jgi:hypothetical protein
MEFTTGTGGLTAPASHKLKEEIRQQPFIRPNDVINPINFAVLLEPLWARSTHVMTFRAITLHWPDDHLAFSSSDTSSPAKCSAALGCECVETGNSSIVCRANVSGGFPLRQSPRFMLICFCLFRVGYFGIGYQLVFARLP